MKKKYISPAFQKCAYTLQATTCDDPISVPYYEEVDPERDTDVAW